jgi:hypothetical protein
MPVVAFLASPFGFAVTAGRILDGMSNYRLGQRLVLAMKLQEENPE